MAHRLFSLRPAGILLLGVLLGLFTAAAQAGLTPEITISGQGFEIASGDTTPSPHDFTAFGAASLGGGSSMHTFRITNTGTVDLNLNGVPKVMISGPNAADF